MNVYDAWMKALKNTEIIRSRVTVLRNDADTAMPYIFLAESTINRGDTVVRKGEVVIQKPSLVLPPNLPRFEGFDLEAGHDAGQDEGEEAIVNFFLVRGISIPSYRYNNKTHVLDVFEGRLTKAIAFYKDELLRQENVRTGLIIGLEECWQMSVLLYNCSQVVKNADYDIRHLINAYKKKK